jgi:hypothetical protein
MAIRRERLLHSIVGEAAGVGGYRWVKGVLMQSGQGVGSPAVWYTRPIYLEHTRFLSYPRSWTAAAGLGGYQP